MNGWMDIKRCVFRSPRKCVFVKADLRTNHHHTERLSGFWRLLTNTC